MRNIKRKEEGVSPVIATILMVAITVVLAATLYMMLPSGGGGDSPLSAQLTYNSGRSSPSDGEATFDLSMSDPNTADLDDVKITLLNADGNSVGSANGLESGDSETTLNTTLSVKITHLSSADDEISGGDRIRIVSTGTSGPINNYEIVLSIDGYDGSRSAVIG